MKGQQLPLAVQLSESASYESFFAGPNQEVVAALRENDNSLFLFGPPACGKTHLLHADARTRGAAYLPLRELARYGVEALAGYHEISSLCVDDLDALGNNPEHDVALLRLLDQLRTRNARVVIAAQAPPERLGLRLPDLRTRLTALTLYGLRPLSDEDRALLLRERALSRGLELPDDATRWLLTRLPRDTGTLLNALEALDRASLAAQRRLSLPFVQQVTQSLLQADLPFARGPADAQTAPAR